MSMGRGSTDAGVSILGQRSPLSGLGDALAQVEDTVATATTAAAATTTGMAATRGGEAISHDGHRQGQPRSTPIAIIRDGSDAFDSDQEDEDKRRAYGTRGNGTSAAAGMATSPATRTDDTAGIGGDMDNGIGNGTGAMGGVWSGSRSLSMLNAPYLGSMRQTEAYMAHHDIPPMSLSIDATDPPAFSMPSNGNHGTGALNGNGHGSQSASAGIVDGGRNSSVRIEYGSLVESHQQGRFLDGPASYRDPFSGQVRRLEKRTQFIHGSLPADRTSLHDRIQESTKRIKDRKQKKQENVATKNNDGKSQNGKDQSSGLSSGLSAMMKEASNSNGDATQTSSTQTTPRAGPSQPGIASQHFSPAQSSLGMAHSTTFGPTYSQAMQSMDGMLSTSLTAFEMLQEARKNEITAFALHNSAMSLASHSPLAVPSSLLPPNAQSLFGSQTTFQPLSRSLSDPTAQMRPTTALMAMSPTLVPSAASQATVANAAQPKTVAATATQQHQQQPQTTCKTQDSKIGSVAALNSRHPQPLPMPLPPPRQQQIQQQQQSHAPANREGGVFGNIYTNDSPHSLVPLESISQMTPPAQFDTIPSQPQPQQHRRRHQPHQHRRQPRTQMRQPTQGMTPISNPPRRAFDVSPDHPALPATTRSGDAVVGPAGNDARQRSSFGHTAPDGEEHFDLEIE